jgi:hypothetical protein
MSRSQSKGAKAMAPPFHQRSRVNPTYPNRQDDWLTFFGQRLNEDGRAANTKPTVPCASSCKAVAGRVSSAHKRTARSSLVRASQMTEKLMSTLQRGVVMDIREDRDALKVLSIER